LLRHIECQLTLTVAHLPPRLRCHVLCRLQAVLPLFPSLEQVANAHVKLPLAIDVIRGELARFKNGQKLCIPGKHRIRAKIRGRLLSLILQYRLPHRLERVVVLQGKTDSLFQRYPFCRVLGCCLGPWRRRSLHRILAQCAGWQNQQRRGPCHSFLILVLLGIPFSRGIFRSPRVLPDGNWTRTN
jgi:hypothetical protein